MTSTGTRPRLDSSMPLELAHLRTALVSTWPAPLEGAFELLVPDLRPAEPLTGVDIGSDGRSELVNVGLAQIDRVLGPKPAEPDGLTIIA